MQKPNNGECVWVEYPQGKRFRAVYSAHGDCFESPDGQSIAAGDVAQWSREEHEDVDISDDPKEALKGKLTRD